MICLIIAEEMHSIGGISCPLDLVSEVVLQPEVEDFSYMAILRI